MVSEKTENQCDVLVIGGGPAGATISALLAEKGWHVVVLEKDHHPRFHIGESLLPQNLHIFRRLGVLEQIERIGIIKYGAEFNYPQHPNKRITYFFEGAMDKSVPYAFQVKRSEFDKILLDNSAARGARVWQGVKVNKVDFADPAGPLVHAEDDAGQTRQWRARYVVDASGRGTCLANQLKIKHRNPNHNSTAIFAHFDNVERRPGREEGNISIYWFQHGWFWMIPFRDGQMSVGAVCWPHYLKSRQGSVKQFLRDTIARCPEVAVRMQQARIVSPVWATGNFSYQSERMAGKGYLMVGDAFAFIDPVFSSGVYLAMNSAEKGAEVVDAVLRQPVREAALLREYDRTIRRGLKTFSWFIYRITQPAMRNMFMGPRNFLNIKTGILSLLAGDVFGKSPVRFPLAMFKIIYGFFYLFNWRANVQAKMTRRQGVLTPVELPEWVEEPAPKTSPSQTVSSTVAASK